jgi:hypothetical protein
MKKQFKFAVAIKNYDQETIDFCKELGYEVNSLADNNYYYKFLINDHGRVNGAVTNIHYTSGQTLCNWKTEKELCKALLAATDGIKIFEHEYIYLPKENTINKSEDLIVSFVSHLVQKPTLKKLLTHFRNKPMEKTILGYECPMDLYGGKIKKGEVIKAEVTNDNGNIVAVYNDTAIFELLPIELVKSWKPIYEDDKLFLDDEKTIEIEVITKDAIRFDCVIYDKYVFDQICILSELQGIDVYIHNHKVSLEKLEKIKEMLNK